MWVICNFIFINIFTCYFLKYLIINRFDLNEIKFSVGQNSKLLKLVGKYNFMKVEDYGNGYWGKCFYKSSQKDFNSELFSIEEIESLNIIVSTFRGYNATQIMEKSHEEKAWLENEKSKSLIDYNYAFELIHI